MIYTVTLNPAVDYVTHISKLETGNIMRSEKESVFFGGKGINVSTVLHELGVLSVAMGFLAGFTGKAIEDGMKSKGILTDFVYLENSFTRINIKIRADEETDINGRGPDISTEKMATLLDKLERTHDGDTLVLAGSIPPSLSENTYERIMERQEGKKINFVVDATGKLLLNSLKYKPFLIKPNTSELSEIFSKEITGVEESLKYAARLQEMGAKNVLVSMGAKGAVLLDEYGKDHYMPALDGKVVNTVGSGDSMVAGFIAGYEKMHDYDYALKLGTASGSATACSEGLADADMINRFMKK